MILVATLGLTWAICDHDRVSSRKELRSEFDFALRETVSRIEQRMASYEQMLRGVQGLLATTDLANHKAMHDYVETLQLDANFSGLQIIGIVQRIAATEKAAHVTAMRQRGLADYSIHPQSQDQTHAVIIQREPSPNRNSALYGLDIWPDPVRRFAMEKARDSGMAAITSKVQLAIDTAGQAPPSFIMYLPVFAPGQARDTVAQRRANLIGWVYAAFHMSDFMASLYGKQAPGLALAIYDDVNPSPDALLYRTPDEAQRHPTGSAAPLSAKEYMVVAGHSWTLLLNTQSEFEDRFDRSAATVIAAAGTSLSLSLALLVWFMVTGRERALRLAAEMTDELRHMAQHDSLTHLPNRALFSDRLNQELARARRNDGRCALMFLDLDDFKQVNDNFGHAVGDHLLREFARRLQACVRAADTVGRLGGDEFVVLMPELKESNAALALAEKIRTALHDTFLVDGHSLLVSCSLGIAIYPEDGTDEISLTKNADRAMYRAKESGGDRVRVNDPSSSP
jgi:diguanylate cyclase (GGDEF)-like protein